ncbi:hypothetical protein M011DRAFT_463225 [Sporormia fimetaria CBS 119925]|uniref:DUF7896 domain-containing protein n=1 Tax=Sporormia fimetaria CBS 119925 TaxID=1340428 RepID=A0A6A6VQ09_9PLEO|nr:hypothetical protein M011DRAFT_463225 [Sporormia fimetaria CBS 119925]
MSFPQQSRSHNQEDSISSANGGMRSGPFAQNAPKENILIASASDTSLASPTSGTPGKTSSRRAIRLKCPKCNEHPEGFRSEHELRRHTNRVHMKTRKVWVTVDTSPDKKFLANCKACQSGKRYNECYNAASHLRRMHFHPLKRGERKMSAAEARKGELDPPMEFLKQNWLREVEEVVGEGADDQMDEESSDASPRQYPQPLPPLQPPQQPSFPPSKKQGGTVPPTPVTPSTRMTIESIVD